MSKSSVAPFRLVQRVRRQPGGLFVAGDDHLGDAFAILDDKGLGREVHQDDAYLAAVVGIYGARRIEHRDAPLQGQAAAGADLRLIAGGQGDVQARGHQAALQGRQRDGLVQVGAEVQAGGQGRGIRGQGMLRAVYDGYVQHNFAVLG